MYIEECNRILEESVIKRHSLNDDAIKTLILADPCQSMMVIEDLEEDDKEYAISIYPWCLQFIEEPSDELQIYSLSIVWNESWYKIIKENMDREDDEWFEKEIKKLKIKLGPMG